MKLLFLTILLTVNTICNAQTPTTEEVLFSFKTENGKVVQIVRDRTDKYLLYRFGNKKKIEMEYPAKDPSSWRKFTYSFYLRGGGVPNEGKELNYLYFTKDGYKYVVYQAFHAVGDKLATGVKVINLATGKTTEIKGLYPTIVGSLSYFRDKEMVQQGDEVFD